MTRGRLDSIGLKNGGEQRCAAYPARVAFTKISTFLGGVATLIKLEFTRIRGSRACQELADELEFQYVVGDI